MRTMTLSDRLGALSGAAYVVLILVGNGLAVSDEQTGPLTGARVLAEAARSADSTRVQVGIGLEVLGFVSMAFFLAWFCDRLRSEGSPWLSRVAMVGGLSTLAIKLASAAPVIVLMNEYKSLDEPLALALQGLGDASFVISFLSFGIFLLGAGLAILESGTLGKAAAWAAVVLGVGCLAAPIASRLDPFASNPIPFLLGLLWVLVISVRLGVRRPQRVDDRELVAA